MRRPSASSAEAFVRCAASHVLPSHDSYSEYAEKGTDGHKLLADVVARVPGSAVRLASRMPGLLEKMHEVWNGVEDMTAEDAFVVDLESRTSMFLGRNIDRKYEQALGRKLRAFEICTSLDVKGRKAGRLWLRDNKFGITSSWWQLYVQAMALLWLPGHHGQEDEVDAGFTFIEDRDDAVTVTSDEATLYLVDLDARADELMAAFGAAERLETELEQGVLPVDAVPTSQGSWCTYCGAFPHCPSKWKLAKSMLSLDVVGSVDALTLEQCGSAWLKLAEIKKNIVKKMEDALKERMRAEGGFPLPDGKRLKVIPMAGRTGFDKEGAIALMIEMGVPKSTIEGFVKRGEGFDSVRRVNDE